MNSFLVNQVFRQTKCIILRLPAHLQGESKGFSFDYSSEKQNLQPLTSMFLIDLLFFIYFALKKGLLQLVAETLLDFLKFYNLEIYAAVISLFYG